MSAFEFSMIVANVFIARAMDPKISSIFGFAWLVIAFGLQIFL